MYTPKTLNTTPPPTPNPTEPSQHLFHLFGFILPFVNVLVSHKSHLLALPPHLDLRLLHSLKLGHPGFQWPVFPRHPDRSQGLHEYSSRQGAEAHISTIIYNRITHSDPGATRANGNYHMAYIYTYIYVRMFV